MHWKKMAWACLALGACCIAPLSGGSLSKEFNYPNFTDNPLFTGLMQRLVAPYLLPLDHPIKPALDRIFSQGRVFENERTLVDAGFEVIAGPMAFSFIIVARHPEVPGYVFKLYLDSETRHRKEVPHWMWLCQRCQGATGIRKVVQKRGIRHFIVPDKWLYPLPAYPFSSSADPQPVVLIATDVQPVDFETSLQMWKTVVTREHLDELYAVLKEGYGGAGVICLSNNVPFTQSGKFAFTDTEDPRKAVKLKWVKKYLSREMQDYWDSLIN